VYYLIVSCAINMNMFVLLLVFYFEKPSGPLLGLIVMSH
jgi:hypothetical protein